MSEQLEQYKFSFPLQMRWNDLDALGHVNNATFITYFEIARSHYMLEACPGWDWHKDMFLLVNVNANYHKELLLTAKNPQVKVRTGSFGTKSFVLEYLVTAEEGDKTIIHASGSTTQVFFDMKSKQTVLVPDWVKESILGYES